MQHLFVPHNIAILAIQKGFDRECLKTNPSFTFFCNGKLYDYPIYQQLTDWFREEHGIHIKIDDFIDDINGIEWDYEIVKVGNDIDENGNYIPLIAYSTDEDSRSKLSYYEAYNKALEEAFKLI